MRLHVIARLINPTRGLLWWKSARKSKQRDAKNNIRVKPAEFLWRLVIEKEDTKSN